MYLPHLIDEILDFYWIYVVDNLPFLTLLRFLVFVVIFVLRFSVVLTGACIFYLETDIEYNSQGFEKIIKRVFNFFLEWKMKL